jgi:hypothetical protein
MTSIREGTAPFALRLRKQWTTAFILGEFVGFIPPAATGAILAALNAPDGALVVG